MNNQIKDLKLQTFGGKESEVAFACEKSHRSERLAGGARGLMKGERLAWRVIMFLAIVLFFSFQGFDHQCV